VFLFASLTLAAMLVGAALGYTSVSPVAVQTCAIEPVVTNYLGGGGDSGTFLPETLVTGENLYVKFLNTTDKQISKVNFAVTDGTNHAVGVVDVGKFSPGVAIVHTLKYMPDVTLVQSYDAPVDDPSCTASSVRFSDGTTWMAPVSTTMSART
jgi:hypothetical protein